MRDFFRMAIRMIMVIFLVAGCVQNIYYLGEITKNAHSYNGYGNYRYNNRNNFQDVEEIEEIEEVPADTSQVTDYEDEYLEYNRQIRPVTYY